jgi:hypothetical protein
MTRIHLNGEGLPIPSQALPDGLAGETLSPLTFTFEEDGSFDKTEWEALGFTIFEVMCVGGAGGRASRAHYVVGLGQTAPALLFTTGGGGGGGGMHIVSGLLSELDDISPIVVGQAGAHAADSPITYNDLLVDPGDPGADGGFSTFADDICMASGGKGGEVSPVQASDDPSTSRRPGGNGGDGGIGAQTAVGGGASGGVAEEDGSWTVSQGGQGFWDGIVGEGGGGGVGMTSISSGVGGDAAWVPDPLTVDIQMLSTDYDSTNGGHGSFSYADSSKHGVRQVKFNDPFYTDYNLYNKRNINIFRPGGGGGARPTPLAKYGSYADGYSPNGVVIVRIS